MILLLYIIDIVLNGKFEFSFVVVRSCHFKILVARSKARPQYVVHFEKFTLMAYRTRGTYKNFVKRFDHWHLCNSFKYFHVQNDQAVETRTKTEMNKNQTIFFRHGVKDLKV